MAQAGTCCPARAKQRFRYSCQGIIVWQSPVETPPSDRRIVETRSPPQRLDRRGLKKGAAIAGGSKSKQGGVKQSGQEPLDVQKMDVLVMVAKA
jgi:hypothetical protein